MFDVILHRFSGSQSIKRFCLDVFVPYSSSTKNITYAPVWFYIFNQNQDSTEFEIGKTEFFISSYFNKINKTSVSINSIIKDYPDHGIITYDEDYINENNNNVFAPVKNIMGMFKTYVYTKDTFDPAPRIFQECRYFGKEVIYQRDKSIKDGGSVYWDRGLKDPDISNIATAIQQFAGQRNTPVKKG